MRFLVLLGNVSLTYKPFSGLDKVLKAIPASLSNRKRFEKINSSLLACIQKEKEPCFLLPQVIDFISRVNQQKLLLEPYRLLDFEFWLNHYSNLSVHENRHIRCKIVGKNIDRSDYQLFFPIGMNKTLAGSHFVAAHLSPDVDTTIASFWGWVDAFGAQVGSGTHQWALPGQIADSHIAMLFQKAFGREFLEVVARKSDTLTLTALDLVSNKNVLKLNSKSRLSHVHGGKELIVIDDLGHFVGDWRASDAELVRHHVTSFYSLIRWLEHAIYYKLISAYAKEKVTKKDVQEALDSLFTTKLTESEPALEFTDTQKKQVDTFLKAVLKIASGIRITYRDLVGALAKAIDITLPTSEFVPDAIFTKDGILKEDRSKLFTHLEKLFRSVAEASSHCRHFLDRLDVLLAIKDKVLNIPSQFITLKSEVEEIRTKMNTLEYLTVVIPEEGGNWFPVGVVYASDLKRKPLGTVSLRDFSNEGETKMASYLDVVSVIDHHKTDIKTQGASTITIGDAQSANTIVSELVVTLNERYSHLGISQEVIDKEIKTLQKKAKTPEELRKLKRLLELALNIQNDRYIHPDREYYEYLFFLHAILDDTDLLTKVSLADLEAVKTLLNRLKSLVVGRDAEIITFTDIKRDEHFIENASRRILQNEDMYSIYETIYAHKEKEVETNLTACVQGKPSTIFLDTKVQNGCARIGQTKLFSTNFATFSKHRDALQNLFFSQAQKIFLQSPQIDLHMQMITTIATASEVYHAKLNKWRHKDELWIYVPSTQGAFEHLVNFLNAFSASPLIQANDLQVEFLGDNYLELEEIFSQNFAKATQVVAKEKTLPIAVLRYKAGLLNSRKAFISPYLPRLIA